jgi:hypothetical protein
MPLVPLFLIGLVLLFGFLYFVSVRSKKDGAQQQAMILATPFAGLGIFMMSWLPTLSLWSYISICKPISPLLVWSYPPLSTHNKVNKKGTTVFGSAQIIEKDFMVVVAIQNWT